MISSFANVRAGVGRCCDNYNESDSQGSQSRTVDYIAEDNDDGAECLWCNQQMGKRPAAIDCCYNEKMSRTQLRFH